MANPLILFSKLFQPLSLRELVVNARNLDIDGYDLCVRPGHLVTPENCVTQLPEVVAQFRTEKLSVPMITGRADLLRPEDSDVPSLLRAMDQANVRLLKLGYFRFSPAQPLDYDRVLSDAQRTLARWSVLGADFNVKICYHLHSSTGDYFLGSNAAALLSLLDGLDPACVGAYLDAGHLAIEGEPFGLAAAILRRYLSIVSLKDVSRIPSPSGPRLRWEFAGRGIVEWSSVFATCRTEDFTGPFSIHAEYDTEDPEMFLRQLPQEVAFFRRGLSAVPREKLT